MSPRSCLGVVDAVDRLGVLGQVVRNREVDRAQLGQRVELGGDDTLGTPPGLQVGVETLLLVELLAAGDDRHVARLPSAEDQVLADGDPAVGRAAATLGLLLGDPQLVVVVLSDADELLAGVVRTRAGLGTHDPGVPAGNSAVEDPADVTGVLLGAVAELKRRVRDSDSHWFLLVVDPFRGLWM